MNCAQCHNHKFDPFSARDYYRFQGFFVKGAVNNLVLKDRDLWAAFEAARPAEYEPTYKLREALYEGARARLIEEARKKFTPEQKAALAVPEEKRTPREQELAREAELKFQFTPGRIESAILPEDKTLYTELKKKLEAMEKKMPDRPQTWGFYSPATSPTKVDVLPMKGFYPPPYVPAELARARPYLLVAGEVSQRGPELDVGWPALFGAVPEEVNGKPRTVLADWLTSPKNPLTARVWANRIWQYHFGKGIVATASDFGTRGARPTHPELLDWLAGELIRSGWDTKHIQRLIVRSSTYRQSAAFHEGNARIDPENHLLWRWPLRRLESEAIRDSMLAVSGELDRRIGGPTEEESKSKRRTIYLLQRRSRAAMMQKMFDAPTAAGESCPKRHCTTVPMQALFMLNNEFGLERARALADAIQDRAGSDRTRQIESAFLLVLGRQPDDRERDLASRFFRNHPADPAAGEGAALVQFCQVMLNLNEFIYID
jgi:hypothetical protein